MTTDKCFLTNVLFGNSPLFEQIIKEAFGDFDLEEFLSISHLGDRQALPIVLGNILRYCSINLKQIGEGSSRVVFSFPNSNTLVLKVAKNKAGIAQNAKEKLMSEQVPDLFAKVSFETRNKYNLWILSENIRVTPLLPKLFEKQFGFPFTFFRECFGLISYGNSFEQTEELLKDPSTPFTSSLINEKGWKIEDVYKTIEDTLNSHLLNVLSTLAFHNKFPIAPLDLIKYDSWGVSAYTGEVKILDYGLDYKIHKKFYKDK